LLAERGLNVIITARRAERLTRLSHELRSRYDVATETLPLDLSDPGFLDRLQEGCNGKNLGLIVSNAGFGVKGLHHLNSAERLDQMLMVNARAPMLIAHAFIPQLIARGCGGLLFTGSMEGFFGFPWSAGYSASKAFVRSLGEALWQELKPRNVDVMVLAPGATDTEAHALQGIDRHQMSGLMSPRQVAELALAQLGKKPVYVSGWKNNLLIRFLAMLPRRWATAMAGAGLHAVIKKSGARDS
jgi:short-subunit dehydrogenase